MDLSIVIEYLENYGGKKYKTVDKALDSEKEYFKSFYEAGRKAREEFKRFCTAVCKGISGLEMDSKSPSMWVNQGQRVDEYFWSRFKTYSSLDFINNISITIDRTPMMGGDFVLGVYVGLDYNHSKDDKSRIVRQNQLLDLDIPVADDFYYLILPSNGNNYISKERDKLIKRYKAHEIRVVSLLKVIKGPYTADRGDAVIKDTRRAIIDFLPYYEYIIRNNTQ